MVGMSILRPLVISGLRTLPNGAKAMKIPVQRQMQLQGMISVRNGGSGLPIVPSSYEWNRFKDDAYFYLMLGLLPMGAVILYCNLFIGPSELADIPEGYEPKEYEYYKNPIQRWMVKYAFQTPQKEYEKTLHFLQIKADQRYWKLLENKVKVLAKHRQDYKGWYFVAHNKAALDLANETYSEDLKNTGS